MFRVAPNDSERKIGVKRFAVLALLVLLLTPDPSLAQRRRRAPSRRSTPAKAAPKTDESAAVDAERREAARKISGQIKRLSRFLYIYVNKPSKGMEPLTREFLKMVLSKEGQEEVVKDGYFPLPVNVLEEDAKKID